MSIPNLAISLTYTSFPIFKCFILNEPAKLTKKINVQKNK